MNMIGVFLSPISGRTWEMLPEGESIQPEGLWPEGWIDSPEGSIPMSDRKGGTGVAFLF